jgi:hypothetical protein
VSEKEDILKRLANALGKDESGDLLSSVASALGLSQNDPGQKESSRKPANSIPLTEAYELAWLAK